MAHASISSISSLLSLTFFILLLVAVGVWHGKIEITCIGYIAPAGVDVATEKNSATS
jgi:hypothetical protein